MTRIEFIEKLSKINWYRWTSRQNGSIALRFLKEGSGILHCPITVVCYAETGVKLSCDSWREAADKIGMDANLAEDVVRAADCGLDYDAFLRDELIEALQGE